MKRWLHKTLCSVLALSLAGVGLSSGTAEAGSAKLTYADVEAKAPWALQHVAELVQRGIFTGYEDGSFRPNTNVSRIEAITAAVRLMGLRAEAESEQAKARKLQAADAAIVKQKYPWAVGYVAVAASKRILSGAGAEVKPGQPADRLWAAILLVKALGLEDEARKRAADELSFEDAKNIPAEAVGYVAAALEKGVITGYEDNTFRPEKPVSRAELAAMLNRAGDQLTLEEPVFLEFIGMVNSVSGDRVTVVKDRAFQPFSTSPDATIVRGQKLVNVSALQPGDEITAVIRDNQFVHINVTVPARNPVSTPNPTSSAGNLQPAGSNVRTGGAIPSNGAAGGLDNGRVAGKVAAVAPGQLTIAADGTETQYSVDENVGVAVNYAMGSWSDIRTGDEVTALISEGRIFHVSVFTNVPSYPGYPNMPNIPRISSVDGYISNVLPNHISIAKDGRVSSYPVPYTAEIMRKGSKVTVDKLVPGDQATAVLENGAVKSLYVSLPFEWDENFYILEGTYQSHRIGLDRKITEVTVVTEMDGNPIIRTLPVNAVNLLPDQPPTLFNGRTKLRLQVINQSVLIFEIME